MNFNSLTYLIFFPIVLILYWIIPGKFRWILLLIASYYFYMSWNPWLAFLIAGTTLVSYLAAILIEKTEKKAWKRFLAYHHFGYLLRLLGFLLNTSTS